MIEQIPYHRPYPFTLDDYTVIWNRWLDCFESGQLTNGRWVRELEYRIEDLYQVQNCIALSSCTQGLLGCIYYLMERDCINSIELPSFIWKSLQHILNITKLEPLWLDIDIDTWLPEYSDDYQIGLHTFGNVQKENQTLFDGSHALGCKLPNIGEATVFSLAPTKLITSCEGGLVITNNDNLAEFVREFRDRCARMSELHAIIGLQTLKYLEKVKAWKKEVYLYYKSKIPGNFQEIPYDSNYNTIGFLNLEKLKIPSHITTKQYYIPLKRGLKNTEFVYSNIVCLPSYYNCPYKQITKDILECNEK